jgi:hypothetical protein
MEPLQRSAARAWRDLLAAQPTSSGKVMFAWRMAAGSALARAGTPHWSDNGVLRIDARDAAWRREIQQARPVILERMNHILGEKVVLRIVVRGDE